MKSTLYIQQLVQVHQLIAQSATGTPQELSYKLHVSKRTIHNYISTLRDMKAPIVYNFRLKTYYYESEWEFDPLQFLGL